MTRERAERLLRALNNHRLHIIMSHGECVEIYEHARRRGLNFPQALQELAGIPWKLKEEKAND